MFVVICFTLFNVDAHITVKCSLICNILMFSLKSIEESLQAGIPRTFSDCKTIRIPYLDKQFIWMNLTIYGSSMAIKSLAKRSRTVCMIYI